MSDQNFTGGDDVQFQTLYQLVVHPNDPSDGAQVGMFSYAANQTELSPSATTNSGSQQTKQMHNVSPATTSYYLKSVPHPIKKIQILPVLGSLESPTPWNEGPTNIFRPYDLPGTSSATNNHTSSKLNWVV